MKKHLALILLTAALPALPATITLTASSPVAVGSTVDVIVQATNVFSGRSAGDLVEAYGFNLFVGNSSLFSYLGETPGALFDDISALFAGTPTVAGLANNPAGIAAADFSGPLTLATLHFKALAPGTTSIFVTWNSTDPNQGLVFANLPYGAIDANTPVTAIASVPEPATPAAMVLLGLLVWKALFPRSRLSLAISGNPVVGV